MILLCGIPSEPPLAQAIRAAEQARLAYVVFNQRQAGTDITLEVSRGRATGTLTLRETHWPLDGFTGVYVRLMDWRMLPRNRSSDPAGVEKARLLYETLDTWLEIAPSCRICNRNGACASNQSKPFQAQAIQRAGLLTPETLVTNDPDAVLLFLEAHGRVVYKSISSVRSIVQELRPDQRATLHRVRALPTQFQAFVPGTNVRVHVVGSEVFATEICSEAVDYRYAERDGRDVTMRAVTLPDDVEEKCVRLSRLLDLPLCGIDLKRTPEGVYYCFEVNPSPAYSYYQERTGQPVAQALVRYLAGAD